MLKRTCNLFWKEIFLILSEIKKIFPSNDMYILKEPLWFNSLITIDKNTVYWSDWYNRGIITIHDVLDEDGCFFFLSQILSVLSIPASFYFV